MEGSMAERLDWREEARLREEEDARWLARIREARERAERAGREQAERAEAHARARAQAEAEWKQRIEQGLNALLATTGAVAAAEPTDTAAAIAAIPPKRITAPERIAEVLRTMFPPSGVTDMGWKEADRKLKAFGVITSKPTYYRALEINRLRLCSQSQT
jgi:hypothetical protein